MIKMRNLIPEQNSKSRYEILMDIISDFLELRDGFESRMNTIEEKLQQLKPELDKQDKRLNPDNFKTDDYLQSKDDDDIR
ncbi:hypothetical protein OAC91_02465 [Candidatus Marinimicrobia bacterium]|nr:hypothetical protein [Candidatus Neomarinimicrobiota bacterium]